MIYKMLINNNVSDNIWSFSLTQLSNTLSVVGLLEPCYLAESEGRPGMTFINFFCNFFLSKSTQEGRGDKNCEVITRTHAHTQRNRFYFTKTEHFFYIDTQIQPKLCVICALPTPMPIKKKKKQRKGCCKNCKIHKYCNYCGNPKHISRPSHCTGWAVWLFEGLKKAWSILFNLNAAALLQLVEQDCALQLKEDQV